MSTTDSNMKLSVIIPVYNDEKNLMRAVDSVLKQTLPADEIIIIDDCSTDSTPSIIDGLCEKYSQIVTYKTTCNSGSCTEPINIGIAKSTGEVIVRMDSDDYSYATRFANQVEFLKQNPEVYVVGTSARIIDENGIENVYTPPITNNEMLSVKYTKTLIVHPSAMIRKELFNEIGLYDTERFRCEDMEFWFRCINNGIQLGNISTVGIDYTSNRSVASFKEMREVISLILSDARMNRQFLDGTVGVMKYLISQGLKYF